MLAYVFWHRPLAGGGGAAYERALLEFHRSLARTRPAGLLGSGCFRLGSPPWASAMPPDLDAQEELYEDWYVIEEHAALGVLGAAAVGRGHRTAHDRAARQSAWGTAGLYALVEGEPRAATRGEASRAVWATPRRGAERPALARLLADGADPAHASLWRRELVLGPAPEYCLLAPARPPGASQQRLPAGWHTREVVREPLPFPRPDHG